MEPYAMLQVSYPLFRNKPVTQWYCYNRIELCMRISFHAIPVCFGETSGSHSRNAEPRLKNNVLRCMTSGLNGISPLRIDNIEASSSTRQGPVTQMRKITASRK